MNNLGLQKGDLIVIKVGSNVISGEKNSVNLGNIKEISTGINYIIGKGINVILVSSGAIAVGKTIYSEFGHFDNDLIKKAQLSRLGWHSLLSIYKDAFGSKLVIDSLITHETFRNSKEFSHFSKLIQTNIDEGILNILNENDSVSDEELGFSDNDELAGLVAEYFNAKALILLTNEDGVYKDFGSSKQSLISKVSCVEDIEHHLSDTKSTLGKGGMKSKFDVMRKVLKNHQIGIIANGNRKQILHSLVNESEIIGTIFKN